MFNRVGYQRIFIEAVRRRGEAIHIREIRGGGVRWWFICPLIKNSTPCRRRVGKLYIPPRYKYFGCRHCYELSYRSRQEYDKRIANISLEQIEYINQQMDSIPTSQQVRWAMLYFKAAEYNWRWLDRIGKRLSEPDETKIYETMK